MLTNESCMHMGKFGEIMRPKWGKYFRGNKKKEPLAPMICQRLLFLNPTMKRI